MTLARNLPLTFAMRTTIFGIIGLAISLTATSQAALINPYFENGLEGWTVYVPNPADYMNEENVELYYLFPTPTAVVNEGYLELNAGWGDDHLTHMVTVSQTFHATAGTSLSGDALLLIRCNFSVASDFHASACISINGEDVWRRGTIDLPPYDSNHPYRTTGWEAWDYVIPSDGDYTISFTSYPCTLGSWSSFSGVTETAPGQAVPDFGASGLLLGIALVPLAGAARRKNA